LRLFAKRALTIPCNEFHPETIAQTSVPIKTPTFFIHLPLDLQLDLKVYTIGMNDITIQTKGLL